jgi:hypothetical protein
MRDDLERADRRTYLMVQIEKALRLAQTVDPSTARALRKLAAEHQDELQRTCATDNKVKARARTPGVYDF